MELLPYHQRFQLTRPQANQNGQGQYPDYRSAVNTAKASRWYPLYRLLQERFRGGKGFTDYEIGRLIGLREEYEQGVGRKG
jgi:hypothetical protein